MTCKCLIEQAQHRLFVEAASAQVGLSPGVEIELTALLERNGVHALSSQSLDNLGSPVQINDVPEFVAVVHPVHDEWDEDSKLLTGRIEECTDVTRWLNCRLGQRKNVAVP